MAHFLTVRSSCQYLLLVGRHPDRKRFRVFVVDSAKRAIVGQWEERWLECGDAWDFSAEHGAAISLSWEKEHAKLFEAVGGREFNTIQVPGLAACAFGSSQVVHLATTEHSVTFGFDGRQQETVSFPGQLLHFLADGSVVLAGEHYHWLGRGCRHAVRICPKWPGDTVFATYCQNLLLLGQVAGPVHGFEATSGKRLLSLAPPNDHHPTHCEIEQKTGRIFVLFGNATEGTTSVLRIFDPSGKMERETKLDCNPAAICFSEYLQGFVTGGRLLIRTDKHAANVAPIVLDFLPSV